MEKEILLSQKLIDIKSLSGYNYEVIKFLNEYLKSLGFQCQELVYEGNNSYKVNNLHAIYNPKNSKEVIYFAGHTDVVSEGEVSLWKSNPFKSEIRNENLYGRGAADMKCAIACFLAAVEDFILQNKLPEIGIGFIITNDEENDGVNGTSKVLEWMQQNNYNISKCIVGEPTNPTKLGEMIKIGRRGSINFSLKITGKQGHVAYAEKAINPITIIVDILKILKSHKFDEGNEFFDASNLEVTALGSDNFGNNVIPGNAWANFNIRFNSLHDSKSLIDLVDYVCKKNILAMNAHHEISYKVSGESFMSKVGDFSRIVQDAVENITGLRPVLGTTGGTSDARFIKNYCENLVELGLVNETAHHVNEYSKISEIKNLKKIYFEVLRNIS